VIYMVYRGIYRDFTGLQWDCVFFNRDLMGL